MKIKKNTLIKVLFLIVFIQTAFIGYDNFLKDPYPQEAYVQIQMGNICVQTQEPIWEWINRQKFYIKNYGSQTEAMC